MAGIPWTPTEDNLLRALIEGGKHSYNQMAPQFVGRTGTSLRKRAINYLGVNQKGRVHFTHSYNRAFFSVPNPVNSYVAGYWAADGHVADNPTTRVVAIELSHLEWHQLETFKRLMEYTGPIRDCSYAEREKMCALRFYSAYQLAEDLAKHFGVTPGKTRRLPAPNLTDPHLQLCYLAGLLDGDGCVQISNTNCLSVSYVSSSRAIVEWVQRFVESLGLRSLRKGRKGEIRQDQRWHAYHYQVCGLKAVDLIRRVQGLKQHGIPILDRKWDNPRLESHMQEYVARHKVAHSCPIEAPDSGVYPKARTLVAA